MNYEMKTGPARLFLAVMLLFFGLLSCDDDENSGGPCTDDSFQRTTSIVHGEVLERCVNGKWYAVKECEAAGDCPETAEHNEAEF
ncbi:MAG TPA: hypothetical protein PK573_15680 [Spirochaetota bacterium]|nr:hypothetical protein [Spirochaetota bacterium]HRZ26250.1 hypothetical protein [Spirochaetota bacterium]HSA13115.1 hypothetical protein [Spirochaetota bacterium]